MLQGYVDADYVGELDQRRSTMSYAFTIAGCIVSWKTELQDTMVFSIIEAECIVAVKAFKETL